MRRQDDDPVLESPQRPDPPIGAYRRSNHALMMAAAALGRVNDALPQQAEKWSPQPPPPQTDDQKQRKLAAAEAKRERKRNRNKKENTGGLHD